MTRLSIVRHVSPLLLSALLLLVPASSFARDMQGRLGFGFNRQFSNYSASASNAVPGVALKYGMTRDIAAEFVLGVATTTPGNSVTAVKLFKNFFYESNLNFYFLIGGGILGVNSSTSAEFISGLGAEFFIPGIESLGFSFEAGGSFTNVTGTFALKTFGASFLEAGMHFYF